MREIQDESSRVLEKSNSAAADTVGEIDALLGLIESQKDLLLRGTVDVPTALSTLQTAVKASEEAVHATHKGLAAAVLTLSQAVERISGPERSDDALTALDSGETRALLHLVAQQLYHEGYMEIADTLVERTSLSFDSFLRGQYVAMHSLAHSIRSPTRDVTPVLQWCDSAVQETTAGASPPSGASLEGTILREGMLDALRTLKFRLHFLQCVRLMMEGSRDSAVQYVRNFLTPLARTKELYRDVQRLTTSLVYASTQGSGEVEAAFPCTTPYPWTSPDGLDALWAAATDLFLECWCRRYGLPRRAPLQVCVDAGYHVLPALRKYNELRRRTPEMFLQLPSMPLELTYQSWLTCPVTQQQATEGDGPNPAMMLPCAHVISHNALRSLLRPGTRGTLKCPYCPTECEISNCIKLYA